VHPLPEGRQGHEGRLTTLLEGAIAHLERHRVQVNELNVFPVADGDTGDNMLATLRAFRDAGPRGALTGARGNSGVILSQLLAGLVDGGPQEAVRRAYAAVPEPIEGTMLTVAHDMAAAGDLEEALQAGRDSLRRGPSLLPALREAGVVDSGGYALTLMVAGALAPGFEALFASLGVEAVSEVAPFDGGSVTVIAEPQAALVASLAFDAARPPEENSAAVLEAIARVRTASVPAGGDLAAAVAALSDGAELITVVTGEDAPLGEEEIRALVPPGVEVEVTPGQVGGDGSWWWLIAAE